jgi:hypothetical protein
MLDSKSQSLRAAKAERDGLVDGIKKILEFRAESFQQLLLPPRRKEFDGVIEPLRHEWL